MALKYAKNRVVAKLVTENRQPCVFCQQNVDDEVIYGKLYSLGDIQCHYFCVLLSCCLVQKGKDSEGLFGFLYKDILAEVERSKKHKCSYCGRGGAGLGCSVSACRKQFHLPCGRQKNAVSIFYGNYKSFCEIHAPKQKISESVMVNAKARMKRDKLMKAGKIPAPSGEEGTQTEEDSAMVCVICYEEVQGYPTTQTFWPPCCGRDAWLHRSCLQRMALSAGMHYLKCPLCNDKDNFYEAVCDQGYYLPDRDAAWELEQNAFAEMYSRDTACAATDCKCPFGRTHDELGIWDIKLCLLCGSWGMHAHCLGGERPVCASCRPAAEDIEQLESRLTAVILAEQAREQRSSRSGPVMPSRMSLRRTKGRVQPHSSTSSTQNSTSHNTTQVQTEPQPAREPDRNPRPKLTPNLKEPESKLLSPMKLLQQTYMEKGLGDVHFTDDVIQKITLRFSRPSPLSAKKKIVNEILDDFFKNVLKDTLKTKAPVKEWNSPKKSLEFASNVCERPKRIPELMMTINEVETGTSNRIPETIIEIDSESEPDITMGDETFQKENEDISENCNSDEVKSFDEPDNKENNPNELDTNVTINADDVPKDNDIPENNTPEDIRNDDESSTSTFELPSEFVAHSDESLPMVETPKRTVVLTQSGLEISEHDENMNTDVIDTGSDKENENMNNLTLDNKKMPFKLNPNKDENLNTGNETKTKKTKNRKRKLEMKDVVSKKRKKSQLRIKIKTSAEKARDRKRAKRVKKIKHLQKSKVGLRVKINLKHATKRKIKKPKKVQKVKSFKQYVLKYSPVQTDKVIAKPDADITPIKRKYVKPEKPVDKLVQTSIQSFFKAK